MYERVDLRISRKGMGWPSTFPGLPSEDLFLGYQGVPAGVWVWNQVTTWGSKVEEGDELWDQWNPIIGQG